MPTTTFIFSAATLAILFATYRLDRRALIVVVPAIGICGWFIGPMGLFVILPLAIVALLCRGVNARQRSFAAWAIPAAILPNLLFFFVSLADSYKSPQQSARILDQNEREIENIRRDANSQSSNRIASTGADTRPHDFPPGPSNIYGAPMKDVHFKLPKDSQHVGKENALRVSLMMIHQTIKERFVESPGFGLSRMVRLPAPDDYSPPAEFADITHPFQDKKPRRGTEPPRQAVKSSSNSTAEERQQWRFAQLELVSLLKHDVPAAYITENLPDMASLDDIKTRELDSFETKALERLRNGEELVVESHPAASKIRMLGSLRATRHHCLKCHNVEKNALLGAFTYSLVPAEISDAGPTPVAPTQLGSASASDDWRIPELSAEPAEFRQQN